MVLDVKLDPETEAWLRGKEAQETLVAQAIVRERMIEEDRLRLERVIQESLASGPGRPIEEFIAEMRTQLVATVPE